jgi:hypothetical protein
MSHRQAVTSDEYDIIRELLSGPNSEALAWLSGGPVGVRTLGEHQSQAESLSLVHHLYALGAESVIATGYDSDQDNSCRHLLVKLPTRNSLRESIFGFERSGVEEHGFEGQPDDGQEYLLIDVKNFG